MKPEKPSRLASLDQFRGYTIVGMMLVNFISHFKFAQSTILCHHDRFCSYADVIMPHFLFAVGFAFRLVWLRTVQKAGLNAALRKTVIRCGSLILLGIIYYGTHFDFRSMDDFNAAFEKRGWIRFIAFGFARVPFQTLTLIGMTTLFVLPVIGANWRWRALWMAGSVLLHFVVSKAFYFPWAVQLGIEGGPLGFLTLTIPLILGTFAHDAILSCTAPRYGRLLAISLAFMAAGYGLSCLSKAYRYDGELRQSIGLVEPPFVFPDIKKPSARFEIENNSKYEMELNYWMMCQGAGTPSFMLFSAGFALFTYFILAILCDVIGVQLPIFRTFGSNALATYLLHFMVAKAVQQAVPSDAPQTIVWISVAVYFFITWILIRGLERTGIYIRM